MRKYAVCVAGVLGLLWPLRVGGQQASFPSPDYQAMLERSLSRETTGQHLCMQNREDIILYYREKLRQVTEERDQLRKQQQSTPAQALPEGK